MEHGRDKDTVSSCHESNTGNSLCEHCMNIFMQKAVHQTLAKWAGLEYRRRFIDMLRSALNGCPLCRELLCMPYNYKPEDHRMNGRGHSFYDRPISWPWVSWASAVDMHESRKASTAYSRLLGGFTNPELRFLLKGDVQRHHYIDVTRHQRLRFREKLTFEVSAQTGDPAAEVVSSRTINGNLDCDQTYVMVREWLATCDTQHHRCHTLHTNSPRTRPALLLDVSPLHAHTGIVRLQPFNDSAFSYAALSYCWGTNQPNATTRSNLATYLKGIVLSSLPQSLQDAITVTRRLALQFLWVDSLCIIQDSEEDKIHEIGKMELIYSNAYITISASCATNCNEGFLGSRKRPKVSIDMPLCSRDGIIGTVALSPLPNRKAKDYARPLEPIHYRAWTFQESFMSRRMLIYSKYQMFWVCSEFWGRDGGRVAREDYFPNELSSRKLRSPGTSDWESIIQEYSTRKLTDSADKLPALSSIAGYFGKCMNDTYLAGLWKSKLSYQLCWEHSRYTDINQQIVDVPATRPPYWRAPSWSFMSVDGYIRFRREDRLKFTPRELGTALGCTIIGCNVVPLSQEAPFGRVASGTLRIQGRLLEIKTPPSLKLLSPYRISWAMDEIPMLLNGPEGDTRVGTLHFDTGEISHDEQQRIIVNSCYGVLDQSSQLWCLLLCAEFYFVPVASHPLGGVSQSHEEWRLWGLTLAKLPNGYYHRVGYFEAESQMSRGFRKQVPQDITIV